MLRAPPRLAAKTGGKGVDVLYDERAGVTAGEKFKDSDLIGIPLRVVVSKKTLIDGKFEIKYRATGETQFVAKDELLAMVKR